MIVSSFEKVSYKYITTIKEIEIIYRLFLIIAMHTTYRWNIKWQKCAGMGLNGFILKKISKNYAENTKKIVGAV